MELLDLPDDVLLLIFSDLYGEHALNVALTSKRLSALALPRVAAVIKCNGRRDLLHLHKYLLSGNPARAQHVRTLAIEVYSFMRGGMSFPLETAETLSWPVDTDGLFQDVSQAHLIGDILLHSQNIRELALERFQPCLQRDPRIGTALASMTNLQHLRLSVIGDTALAVLQSSKADITRLTLSYHTEDDLPLPGEPKTMPALLDALTHFRNLRILKLWNFNPSAALSPHYQCGSTPPELPSITYLRLSESSIHALEMVSLCPNLSTLIFSIRIDFSEEMLLMLTPSETNTAPPKWPPLRRLMLGGHHEILSVLKRLGRVDLLQIGGDLCTAHGVPGFLDLLRVTSPIELYLSVIPSVLPSDFWADVVRAAPRLRVLELKVDVPGTTETHVNLLDGMPEFLAQLRVPCLRLYFPIPQLTFAHNFLANDVEGDVRPTPARELEIRRVKALRSLPQRLLEAMPSLRCLAVLDGGSLGTILQRKSNEDDSDSEDGDHAHADVYEWDELRRTDHIRSMKWWRVVDGPDGRTLQRITEEEGERVQQEYVDHERAASDDALAERVASLSL
ncbi:hypothetical protein GY45DRAFT_1310445 [Cubamyces sp. BRFM 1775]|nr:hypothetical protein GY45DRAFT_1310445 [Cubamyces sp. BRFM 1775]